MSHGHGAGGFAVDQLSCVPGRYDCNGDMIVMGWTFKEHLQNVFTQLRAASVRLQPKKCHLCSPEVEFLEHVVSAEGASIDPIK